MPWREGQKKPTPLSKMEKRTLICKAAAGKRRRPRHCIYGCCSDGCGVAAAEVAAAAAAARLYCSANLQYKRHKTTDRGEMYTPTLTHPRLLPHMLVRTVAVRIKIHVCKPPWFGSSVSLVPSEMVGTRACVRARAQGMVESRKI